jgi:dTDP-4-amino-4,6-dideoxygalactose transaminase
VISVEPPYRALGFDADSTPVANDVFARGLYVSCSPDLTAEDRALIADTLVGVARAAGVA